MSWVSKLVYEDEPFPYEMWVWKAPGQEKGFALIVRPHDQPPPPENVKPVRQRRMRPIGFRPR